jgi:hypothetical protein
MRLNSLGPLRLASLAIVALFPLHAQAQTERILHYHSDLTLQGDGTLLVRELIKVCNRQPDSSRDLSRLPHALQR